MKTFAFMVLTLVLILLLNACATQGSTTQISVSRDASPTLIATLKPTVTPIFTEAATPTPESNITLTKVKEWSGSIPFAWSKDGKNFAIISDDKLELYDVALNLIWSQPLSPEIYASAISFSDDNKFVLVYQDSIKLFDRISGNLVAKSGKSDCVSNSDPYPKNMLGNSNVLYVGFSGNNKLIETQPIQISLWTIQPFHCKGKIITIPVPESGPSLVTTMNLSPNNNYLILASAHYSFDIYQGWIKIWDTNNYSQLCEIPGTYAIFRPSNGLLAIVSKEESVSYWDVAKCKLIDSITIPKYKTGQEVDFNEQAMVFTPDGKYIIMRRASFQVFNADTGELLFDSKTPISELDGNLSISSDGRYFLAQYNENGPVTALWQINRK